MTRTWRTASAVAALALAATTGLPGSARAALITDVADAADKDNPLDVNFDIRWTRTQRQGKILREVFRPDQGQTEAGTGTVSEQTELQYKRWTHVVDLKMSIGLYHDLELHAD